MVNSPFRMLHSQARGLNIFQAGHILWYRDIAASPWGVRSSEEESSHGMALSLRINECVFVLFGDLNSPNLLAVRRFSTASKG